jgi:tRNA A-37 threonylcarbamoyl transferase component Bud32
MKQRLTRREFEALPREALHVARNATKADVYRFEWPVGSGQFVVLKDMKTRPAWFRLLAGRIFLSREYRALRALDGIEGIPRAIARPDADSLVMEWRPGVPVMDCNKEEVRLPALEEVAEIISQAHARGVIHGDLHRSNVLLTPDGEVTLIDWATGGIFGPNRRGAKAWTFEEWRALDIRAVAKLKARYAPQSVTEAEKDVLLNGSKVYRLVRGVGFKVRSLLGHKHTKSPEFAAARYKSFIEHNQPPVKPSAEDE